MNRKIFPFYLTGPATTWRRPRLCSSPTTTCLAQIHIDHQPVEDQLVQAHNFESFLSISDSIKLSGVDLGGSDELVRCRGRSGTCTPRPMMAAESQQRYSIGQSSLTAIRVLLRQGGATEGRYSCSSEGKYIVLHYEGAAATGNQHDPQGLVQSNLSKSNYIQLTNSSPRKPCPTSSIQCNLQLLHSQPNIGVADGEDEKYEYETDKEEKKLGTEAIVLLLERCVLLQ